MKHIIDDVFKELLIDKGGLSDEEATEAEEVLKAIKKRRRHATKGKVVDHEQ